MQAVADQPQAHIGDEFWQLTLSVEAAPTPCALGAFEDHRKGALVRQATFRRNRSMMNGWKRTVDGILCESVWTAG
jgi:hypothetical protein